MGLTATVTTTQEVKLEPKLLKQLKTELNVHAELQAEIKELKEALESHAETVEDLLTQSEQESIKVDGIKATWVRGVTSSLDKQKFVALGGKLSQLENATVTKPKKAYVKVTKEK